MLQHIMPRIKALSVLKKAEAQLAQAEEALAACQQAVVASGETLGGEEGIWRQRDFQLSKLDAEMAVEKARIELAVTKVAEIAAEASKWRDL